MIDLISTILIGLFAISLIIIAVSYFSAYLTVLNNVDEQKGLAVINILPIFKTDALNETGQKARKIYNVSLLAFYIWLIAAYVCYKIFNQ